MCPAGDTCPSMPLPGSLFPVATPAPGLQLLLRCRWRTWVPSPLQSNTLLIGHLLQPTLGCGSKSEHLSRFAYYPGRAFQRCSGWWLALSAVHWFSAVLGGVGGTRLGAEEPGVSFIPFPCFSAKKDPRMLGNSHHLLLGRPQPQIGKVRAHPPQHTHS